MSKDRSYSKPVSESFSLLSSRLYHSNDYGVSLLKYFLDDIFDDSFVFGSVDVKCFQGVKDLVWINIPVPCGFWAGNYTLCGEKKHSSSYGTSFMPETRSCVIDISLFL